MKRAKHFRPQRLPGNSGQAIIAAILVLVVGMIMFMAVVRHAQLESKWSVKQTRSDRAYHLAEAGQDRALWHMSFSTGIWSAAMAGETLAGYDFDKEYPDVEGGLYKMRITSGPGSGHVTVVSVGKDTSSNEVRAIEAVYVGNVQMSGWVADGVLNYNETFVVYWGQITSFTMIDQTGNPPYYPIKISAGGIEQWDMDPTPPNDHPDKNAWAYVDLGEYPVVDFDYYRDKAKKTVADNPCEWDGSKCTSGDDCNQSAQWDDTGYFDNTSTDCEVKWKDYTFDCSTCVFFVESNKAKIEGSGYLHLDALIIYTGNIHIHNDGANPYTIAVPTDAWKQYTQGHIGVGDAIHEPETAAVDEYPGDGGLHVSSPTYTIPTTKFDGASNTGMAYHGFLYTNSFDCSGGKNSLVGQFMVGPGGSDVNTMIIYYDPQVGSNVRYERSPITRYSWNEIVRDW